MTDPQAKPIMLAIATGYERLAMRDDERQTAAKKNSIETHPLHNFSLRSRCTAMLAGLRTLTHAGCGPDR